MTLPERIPLHTLLAVPQGREKLEAVAASIKSGAIFVYPTETIYGIGGAYGVAGVKEKILSAKQRPPDNPMILIAPDRSFFASLPIRFPPAAERLSKAFWPGLLTLILPSSGTPEGVAIRVARHPLLVAFFRHIDTPIYSTSANRSGEAYVNDPDLIYSLFSGAVGCMIDAGKLPPSLPSTVVRIGTDNTATVVRQGIIPEAAIRKALDSSLK